jgi:hypothetical protein
MRMLPAGALLRVALARFVGGMRERRASRR